MTTHQQALVRLADALVEDILRLSDEDVLAEFREDHGDPAVHAAQMRELLETCVRAAHTEAHTP